MNPVVGGKVKDLEQSLRDELARLRATTPAAGRTLDVAALIRDDRDGR